MSFLGRLKSIYRYNSEVVVTSLVVITKILPNLGDYTKLPNYVPISQWTLALHFSILSILYVFRIINPVPKYSTSSHLLLYKFHNNSFLIIALLVNIINRKLSGSSVLWNMEKFPPLRSVIFSTEHHTLIEFNYQL